ncbi:hypothetical protein [Flammeovirga agarivorans]|uniref:Sensor of ECF-type sigma factor n=1 Tax=Flammeovirga agarivorans TaxID=2726742 RepID=A0A7X8SM82_9BACT|nr:hypothetical protein [Flammeovirga agarivorans]NLR92826.1 hypothetical protein [Flammeovirga agarivorans]
MKKLFVSLFLLLGLAAASNAQNIDTETIKTVIKTEKRIFFTENMQLSLDEAGKFWELYDEYELAKGEIGREKTKLFEQMIEETDGITDEEAQEMVLTLLDLQQRSLKVEKKYMKIMMKELSPKTVARFFQLNELVNSFLKTQILSEMPIIQK